MAFLNCQFLEPSLSSTAYSGGSGAYARASLSANKISLQDYNVIYTKVGLGGKSGAKATEIRYL